MQTLEIQRVLFRENESFLMSFSAGPKRDKGQLFLVLDLPDNPGAEDSIAEKIWRSIHDTFYNCNSDDEYFCLEEALKAANEIIEKENKKRETGTIGRVNGIASLLSDDTLHFSQTGRAQIALKRGHHYSVISEELEESDTVAFNSISSGEIAPEDIVVFSSRSLPFDDETLLEVFSEKMSKLSSSIKALAKKKELIGMLAYFQLPTEDEGEVVSEDEEELFPEEKETAPEETPMMNSGKGKRSLSVLRGKMNSEKMKKAQETMKNVYKGVSSRLVKLVKKPNRIKQVNRRYIILAVLGLVIVLGGLLVLQSNFRQKSQQSDYYQSLLSDAEEKINVSEQRFLIGEKSDATKQLNQAAVALDEIEAAGFFSTQVGKFKEMVAIQRDNFDKVSRVTNPNVVVDLSQKGTVDALGIIHTEDQKNFVYEPRRLFESVLDKVQEPLEIDPEEIVLAGTELVDFNVLSFSTQGGQMIEYETRNGRFQRASTQDDTWHRGVDVKSFNGQFLYLLDPPSNTIWKYSRLRSGYSGATAWTSDGDLSDAVSFAIDGEVYVLMRNGTIARYLKGTLQPFEIKDAPTEPLNNPTRIFTHAEASHLYVLDSANQRVVIYSKGQGGIGSYQKQVLFESLKPNEIRDFYVDQDEQKLTILTSDKVYITDL